MKVACVMLLALVAVAFAQFDLNENAQGATVSLSGGNIRNGTVLDTVFGCEINIHDISGAATDDVASSSGSFTRTHWLIQLVNLDDEDLLFQFYNGEDAVPIAEVSGTGCSQNSATEGDVNGNDGDNCRFEYWCDTFFDGPFHVEVYQPDTPSEVSSNYTLTVTQFLETVTVIGDQYSEDSLVFENAASSNGNPPSKYAHYYHVLNRNLEERGLYTEFRARAFNFRDEFGLNFTGGEEVRLCIQVGNIVAEEEASVGTNDPTNCPETGFCSEDTLTGSDQDVTVDFFFCAETFDAIFIGVYTPDSDVAATFDLEILPKPFTTVPIFEIDAPKFEGDNRLSECDSGATANFTCEAHYHVNLEQAGLSASSFNGKTGPYYSAYIHGTHDGDFTLGVAEDDFASPEASCFGGYTSCSVSENTACEILISPCQWNSNLTNFGANDEWVASVTLDSILSGGEQTAFYGIDIEIFEMPHDVVALAPSMGPFIDVISENRYHHYSIAIPSSVTELDQLVVEMYSRVESHSLTLFWQKGDFAGQECLTHNGRCETRGTHNDIFAPGQRDFCRFQFLGCETPFVTDSFTDLRLYSDYSTSGLRGQRVATLSEGTYYFSVFNPLPGNDSNIHDGFAQYGKGLDVEYTLMMWFTGAIELELDVTQLGHVFYHEYSNQYYIDMPEQEDDFTIAGLNIHVADVQFGVGTPTISAYWECDKPAGDCPCWTNQQRHDFDIGTDNHVKWFIPRCSCSGRVYIAVENRNPIDQNVFHSSHPVGYTVLATVARNDAASASLIDGIFTSEIEITRYPEWARVTNLVRPALTESACSSCLQYTFYRYDFTGVTLLAEDTLVTRIEFTPEAENETPEAWLFVLSSPNTATEVDTCGDVSFELSTNLQACRARANLDYADYWDNSVSEEWSYCQIVFEACTAAADDEKCFEENNDFRGDVQNNRRFDQTREWYAAVQVVADDDSVYGIHYTLYSAVRSGVTALSSGVALKESVFEKGYNHYSFAVSEALASGNQASLRFEFYSNADQYQEIGFYINKGSLAGLETDCFESNQKEIARVCNACYFGAHADGGGSCQYEIIPCDLEAATYYVSAHRETSEFHTHAFFNDLPDYTIVARIETATELLGSPGNGHPVTGNLRFNRLNSGGFIGGPRAHYTVTVPGSGDISSRLRITVSSLAESQYNYFDDEAVFFVTVVKDNGNPADLCRCPLTGRDILGAGEAELNFERDNCDLNGGDKFFITIDAFADLGGLYYRREVEDITFTVHAELLPIDTVSLQLTTSGFGTDVFGIDELYNSHNISASPRGPFTVEFNKYVAYTFTVNGGAGTSMNVKVIHEIAPTDGAVDYFLSSGRAQGLPSINNQATDSGSGSVGPSVEDGFCTSLISCSFSGGADQACNLHVTPCDFVSGTYFITLGGENLLAATKEGRFHIGVSTFNFAPVIDVDRIDPVNNDTQRSYIPSNIDSDSFGWYLASDNDDLDANFELRNGGNLYLSSSSQLSIDAGQEVRFRVEVGSSSGVDMYVSLGDANVGPGCSWACQDLGVGGSGTAECSVVPCSDMSETVYIALIADGGHIRDLGDVDVRILPAPLFNFTSSLESVTFGEDFDTVPENFYPGHSNSDDYAWFTASVGSVNEEDTRYYRIDPNEGSNDLWVIDSIFGFDADSVVVYPSLPANGASNLFALSGNGNERLVNSFGEASCGTVQVASITLEPTCCETAGFQTSFAITGSNDHYIEFEEYVYASVQSGSSGVVGLNGSSTDGLERDTANYHTFDVSKSAGGFYFEFSVDEDLFDDQDVEIYINVGERAGRASGCSVAGGVSDLTDFGCHGNLNGLYFGGSDCDGSISNTTICQVWNPVCVDGLCDSEGDSLTFHLTVISSDAIETRYSFNVIESSANANSYPPASISEEAAFETDMLGYFTFETDFSRDTLGGDWFPMAFSDGFRSDLRRDGASPNWDETNSIYVDFTLDLSVSNVDPNEPLTNQLNITNGNIDNFVLEGSLSGFTDRCAGSISDEFFESSGFCEEINDEFFNNGDALRQCIIRAEDMLCQGDIFFTVSLRDFYAQYDYGLTMSMIVDQDYLNDAGLQSSSVSATRSSSNSAPGSNVNYQTFSSRRLSGAEGQTEHNFIRVNLANAEPTDYLRLYFRFSNNTQDVSNQLSDINIRGFADYLPAGAAVAPLLTIGDARDQTTDFSNFDLDLVTDNVEWSNCGELNADDLDVFGSAECFVQFIPSNVEQIVRDGATQIWLDVDFGDLDGVYGNDTAYSFEVAAVLISADPLSVNDVSAGSIPTLASDGTELIWEKEILDYQWQFITFNVPDNRGLFDTLTVTLEKLRCDTTAPIEAYLSFSEDEDDVSRPGRLPAAQTSVLIVDVGLNTLTLTDCLIVGGDYHISIYAPSDLQLFDDSDSVDVVPASYRVTVSLTERESTVLAPECKYWGTTDVDDIELLVIPVEAENRGSQLRVWVTLSNTVGSGSGSEVLRVSHTNKYDHCNERSTLSGVFYDAAYEYGCVIPNGATGCEIVIPECEFDQGYYHVWVNIDDADVVGTSQKYYVQSEFDHKYTPVVDLSAAGSSHAWQGQLYQDSSRSFSEIQYYKVIVDDSVDNAVFSATLTLDSCDDSECDLEFFITRGAVGFSSDISADGDDADFATGNSENTNDGVYQKDGTSFASLCHDFVSPGLSGSGRLSGSQGETIWDPICNAERNQYYIGVQQNTNSHCAYTLTVKSSVETTDLQDDVLVCDEVACRNFYRYVIPGFAQDFRMEIGNYGGSSLRYHVALNRVPFALTSSSVNTCSELSTSAVSSGTTEVITFSTDCVNEGVIYIGIYDGDRTDDCDSCNDVYQFSIKVTALDSGDWTAVEIPEGQFLSADVSTCAGTCSGGAGVHALTGRQYVRSSNVTEFVTPSTLSPDNRVSVSFDTEGSDRFEIFHINLAANSILETVYITFDQDTSCDDSVVFYTLSYGAPDFCSCSDSGTTLDQGASCGTAITLTPDCADTDAYLSVFADCTDSACPTTFTVWYEQETVATVDGVHTDAFETAVWFKECGTANTYTDYVQVDNGILSVALKEPWGGQTDDNAVTSAFTASYSRVCDGYAGSCTAVQTASGQDSSCRTDEFLESDSYNSRYSCVPAGLYRVDIVNSGLPEVSADYASFGVQYQIVNQWVSLSSAADTIIGAHRHFFSVSTAGTALQIRLNVRVGPAISMFVFDGCDQDRAFEHHQVCYFGNCLVDVSTRALHSGADNFYVVLTAGDLNEEDLVVDNTDEEKPTEYTLTAATGTSACASRPSNGFCGSNGVDFDDAFTSSAFTISDSTWAYLDVDARNDMAKCRYESFVNNRCPKPDDECKRWLRTLSCLESFPACDAAGFLQGTCQAVCEQVECACGKWLDETNQPRPEYGCLSGRYQPGETGSCAVIPVFVPPPPPVVVVPTLIPTDIQKVHMVLVDSGLLNNVAGAGNGPRAVSCSASEIEALLYIEARRGDLPILDGQIVVAALVDNEAAVLITGSTFESADSLAVRLHNLVSRYPDESLDSTCLAGATWDIEEPEDSLVVFSSQTVPESVLNPPLVVDEDDDNGFTVPDGGFTIPDLLSSSDAVAALPSIFVMVFALVALYL